MAATLTSEYLEAGLVSNNIAGLKRFYSDILGFPTAGSVDIPNIGQITRFQVGKSTLRVLVPLKEPVPEQSGSGFSSTIGIRYLALKISNLSEVVDQIAAEGFKIIVPIQTLRPGVQVALVEDSDSNTVELMEENAQ